MWGTCAPPRREPGCTGVTSRGRVSSLDRKRPDQASPATAEPTCCRGARSPEWEGCDSGRIELTMPVDLSAVGY